MAGFPAGLFYNEQQMSSITWVLVALYALLQAADALTTWRNLSNGGQEMNPVMSWVFDRIGVAPGLVVTKLIAIAFVVFVIEILPLWVLLAIVIVYAAVVIHNLVA